MRKQTKIAALVSAAALLAIGASMTSFANPGWNGPYADGSFEYHDSSDEAVFNEWHTGTSSRDGKTYYYYLDDNGKMAVDTLIEYDDGNMYYVNANGERVADYWYAAPNTEGIEVNGIQPANLYYYFNSKGQAVTGKQNIRKSNSDATKSYFQFDSEYHMVSGWYGDYFCSGEDEGYVLTGWQYLDKPLDDVWENPYDYDNKAWYCFGTDGAMKKGRQWLEWEGKYSYYVFADNGQLLENGWSSAKLGTDPNATPNQLQAYYIDGGARAKGWVEADYDGSGDDHSKTWFYAESNGVPFNYNGKDASGSVIALTGDNAGKTFDKVAARKIDGKIYLFNEYGEYMTGIYRVVSKVFCTGSTSPLEKGKIYYFSGTSGDPKGSMVTKKVQMTADDIVDNYCFKSNGQAAEREIISGVLYGVDGKRIEAEDALWQVCTLPDNTSDVDWVSDKKIKVTNAEGKEVTVLAPLDGYSVIVNASGRVKESGTVTIDGRKYYIKTVPSTKPEGYQSYVGDGYTATSYVVVGYVDVD